MAFLSHHQLPPSDSNRVAQCIVNHQAAASHSYIKENTIEKLKSPTEQFSFQAANKRQMERPSTDAKKKEVSNFAGATLPTLAVNTNWKSCFSTFHESI